MGDGGMPGDGAGREGESLITVISEDRQPTTPNATGSTPDAIPHPSDAMIEHLQEEVSYLRERLEDAMGQLAGERRRADVLSLNASLPESAGEDRPDETSLQTIYGEAPGLLDRLRGEQ